MHAHIILPTPLDGIFARARCGASSSWRASPFSQTPIFTTGNTPTAGFAEVPAWPLVKPCGNPPILYSMIFADCHAGLSGHDASCACSRHRCRHRYRQLLQYDGLTLLTLNPVNMSDAVLPASRRIRVMPSYPDSAEEPGVSKTGISHQLGHRSSADQRQRLRSRPSPQLTPNIDRPGNLSTLA